MAVYSVCLHLPRSANILADIPQIPGTGRPAADGDMAIAKRDDRVQPDLLAARSKADTDGGGLVT